MTAESNRRDRAPRSTLINAYLRALKEQFTVRSTKSFPCPALAAKG
jgi:hypothetical protein